jgi:hypothetical protein
MPSIIGKVDQRRLLIDVGLQPALHTVGAVEPTQYARPMNVRPLRGLFDTGAQMTCITRRAAAAAHLSPLGKVRIGNVSNIEIHNQYGFVLGVWYGDRDRRGYYGFDPILGVDFKDNDDFDVLIGMDVIGQGDLVINRNGDFTWTLP